MRPLARHIAAETVRDTLHMGGIVALAFMAGALLGAPLLVMAVLP